MSASRNVYTITAACQMKRCMSVRAGFPRYSVHIRGTTVPNVVGQLWKLYWEANLHGVLGAGERRDAFKRRNARMRRRLDRRFSYAWGIQYPSRKRHEADD